MDIQKKLLGHVAFGSLSLGDIPGGIEDYHLSLVQETLRSHGQEWQRLRLKFTPKKDQIAQVFYVNFDSVNTPAKTLMLLKYNENQGQIEAKMQSKITRKMMLSVIKKPREVQEQLFMEEEGDQDSDIPKTKRFGRKKFRELEELEYGEDEDVSVNSKPRKRKNDHYFEEDNSNK